MPTLTTALYRVRDRSPRRDTDPSRDVIRGGATSDPAVTVGRADRVATKFTRGDRRDRLRRCRPAAGPNTGHRRRVLSGGRDNRGVWPHRRVGVLVGSARRGPRPGRGGGPGAASRGTAPRPAAYPGGAVTGRRPVTCADTRSVSGTCVAPQGSRRQRRLRHGWSRTFAPFDTRAPAGGELLKTLNSFRVEPRKAVGWLYTSDQGLW